MLRQTKYCNNDLTVSVDAHAGRRNVRSDREIGQPQVFDVCVP